MAADFGQILSTLRSQEQDLEGQLSKVRSAIAAIEGVAGTDTGGRRRGRPAGSGRGRRRGPGRPRKANGAAAAMSSAPAVNGKRRGRRKGYTLSEETRAKMRAAQQARWAGKKK